jgi:sugar phosphate isomerase/epimerase
LHKSRSRKHSTTSHPKGLMPSKSERADTLADAHCDLDGLLADEGKLKAFKHAIESRGLMISALSCHGNPLHPQKAISSEHDSVIRKTIELANRLEVSVVNTFSGCPGDHEDAKYPNWPVAPWPNDFQDILNWQWEAKVIPYWSEIAKLATARRRENRP